MANRQWYVAIGGRQDGPYSDERLRELIASGTVRADTLVWCAGMSNWAKAEEIPGLMAAARGTPPPAGAPQLGAAPQYSGAVPTVAQRPMHHLDREDGRRLAFDPQRNYDRVAPLFWRVILIGICQIVVIPLPWVIPNFLRWFVERIELPDGQRVAFAGNPGDIWYIFILYGLCSYGSFLISFLIYPLASWLLVPLTTLFALIIARWFFANLVWEGRHAPLQFTGGYWALLGWTLLAAVSIITIIGWAWVYAAWARWMCRNVKGVDREFIFTGTGWHYLWRTMTLAISIYLFPLMPWTLRWYVRWQVSQFALVQRS